MKLGKIFICINILVLSLLMLTGCTEKWPRLIYQNTSYRFDEYNRTIVLDGGHSYDIVETENIFHFIAEWGCGIQKLFMEVKGRSPFLGYLNITTWFLIGCFRNLKSKMVFEILMAWENEFVKIFTLFPEIHAPVLSHFITLKYYS